MGTLGHPLPQRGGGPGERAGGGYSGLGGAGLPTRRVPKVVPPGGSASLLRQRLALRKWGFSGKHIRSAKIYRGASF